MGNGQWAKGKGQEARINKYSMLRIVFVITGFMFCNSAMGQYNMEFLTRGVHAVKNDNGGVFVSWRLLGTEDNSLAFNLYRTSKGKTIKLNKSPLFEATGFTDKTVDTAIDNIYIVKAIINRKEEKN